MTTTELTKKNGEGLPAEAAQYTLSPRVDIFANDDQIIVLTDLPGVAADDVKISYEKNRLELSAARSKGGEGITEFARSFSVEGIDGDQIRAELNDGVLRLTMPKADAVKPRQIPVVAG